MVTWNRLLLCRWYGTTRTSRYGIFIVIVLLIIGFQQWMNLRSAINEENFYDNNDYLQERFLKEKGNSYLLNYDLHDDDLSKQKDIKNRIGLSTNDTMFMLDGKPFRILSGEVHYFRFPHQYWEYRLLALKACGLNTITTYIPWNSHEPQEGVFDFTGMLNLPRFLQIADDLEIYVILRVGPYICAEWEYGGLPSWLLKGNEAEVRTSNPLFMSRVRVWFAKLLPLIKPFQYMQGGPVIMVQVENEYASFPNPDPTYLPKLKEIVRRSGIDELLFVCDDRNGIVGMDKRLNYGDTLKTINLQNNPAAGLKELRRIQPNMPMFVSEYWTGWFNWWGGPNHNMGVPWLNNLDIPTFKRTTEELLKTGSSVNLYVFAGGTNFGFMNGGLVLDENRGVIDKTAADTTSYDYSAPVSEEGRLTTKYYAMRSILQVLQPSAVFPNPPPEPILAKYESIQVEEFITLGQLLVAFKSWMFRSEKAIPMERFPSREGRSEGQSYGYALYEITVTGNNQLELDFSNNIRDRALVFMDTIYQDTVDMGTKSLVIQGVTEGRHTLSLLVENQGRINWVSKIQTGVMENQRKGIIADIQCDGQDLLDWRIWPLEFDGEFLKKLNGYAVDGLKWEKYTHGLKATTPVMLKATLHIGTAQPRDTFVELDGFEKGILLVNGINLGRYWNSAGPQKRLYLPGPWLHSGRNEILIFEEKAIGDEISFHKSSGLE